MIVIGIWWGVDRIGRLLIVTTVDLMKGRGTSYTRGDVSLLLFWLLVLRLLVGVLLVIIILLLLWYAGHVGGTVRVGTVLLLCRVHVCVRRNQRGAEKKLWPKRTKTIFVFAVSILFLIIFN